MPTADAGNVAPIVDEAFWDPLIFGDEDVQWLRRSEIETRSLLARLNAAQDRSALPLNFVEQTADKARRLLRSDDGEIYRCARRPLSHLRPGAPGRVWLQRAITDLHERTILAITLVDRVANLVDRVEAVRSTYSPVLPTFTRVYLTDAGLEAERFTRVRSERDLARLEERLSSVTSALQALRDAAADSTDATNSQTLSDGLTLTELRALRSLALRARTSLGGFLNSEMLARETAAGLVHVTKVAERPADGGYRPFSGSDSTGTTARLVEDAAVRALQGAKQASTASFWAGALAAGARALNPISGSFAWTPPLGSLAQAVAESLRTSDAAATDDTGATVYCIPIGQSHVLLSARVRSAIRVYTAAIQPGNAVQCTVTPASDPTSGSALMDSDLTALFEGVDARYPRWYETKRKLRVMVLARDGDEWYGRVEVLGVVQPLPEPPVSMSVQQRVPSAFRIRRDATDADAEALGADDSALIVQREGVVDRMLGIQTFRVVTPFERHSRAFLRRPIRVSRRSTDMVSRERDLFEAMASTAPDQASLFLVPAGLGRLDDGSRLWPCYAMPPVGWPRQDDLERTWVKGDVRRMLQYVHGVARILLLAHQRGFSAGTVTMRQFAVALEWDNETGSPMPRPILMTAPLVAPFGSTYLAPPGAAADEDESYSRLGAPILPPDVAGQLQASSVTDAFGFALFLVDLLLEYPTAGSIDTLPGRLLYDRQILADLTPPDADIVRRLGGWLASLRLDRLQTVLQICGSPDFSWASLRDLA